MGSMMADAQVAQSAKVCTACGVSKPTSEYWRDKKKKDGLCPACKDCMRERHRAWAAAHPEYPAEYRAANPEIVSAASKKWRARNPDKVRQQEQKRVRDPEYIREHNRAYYAKNKAAIAAKQDKKKGREYAAKWRAENAERYTANRRNWIEANRDKVRATDMRRRSTPRGRLDDAISVGIRQTIARGSKAGRKWEVLVGYTLDDLMAHLERLFVSGMTWENYGDWHIDHVVPKVAFNYSSPEHIDFKRCWALSNLQPLWALDNMSKHDRLTEPFQPSFAI